MSTPQTEAPTLLTARSAPITIIRLPRQDSLQLRDDMCYDIDDMRLFRSKYGRMESFLLNYGIRVTISQKILKHKIRITIEGKRSIQVKRAKRLLQKNIIQWFSALRRGKIKQIVTILKEGNIQKSVRTKCGATSLMVALGHGGIDSIKNKAIILQTPINTKLVKLLLDNGFNDKNAEDSVGNTAFDIAIERELYFFAVWLKPDRKVKTLNDLLEEREANDNEHMQKPYVRARRYSLSDIFNPPPLNTIKTSSARNLYANIDTTQQTDDGSISEGEADFNHNHCEGETFRPTKKFNGRFRDTKISRYEPGNRFDASKII